MVQGRVAGPDPGRESGMAAAVQPEICPPGLRKTVLLFHRYTLTALQVKFGESGEVKHINIDHPAPELPDGPAAAAAVQRPATPEPEPSIPEVPSTIRKISEFATNEYPSPAFVKRARLSYGALFEGGFDIFEEDGGIKGRGRKRTRFGRDSSAWRYSSQSPSPEPTSPVPDAMEEDATEDVAPQPSPKPGMMDEGCQTVDVEMAEAAPEPVDAAPPRREKTPVPPEPLPAVPGKGPTAPAQNDQVANHQTKVSFTPTAREELAPVVQKQRAATPTGEFGSITDLAAAAVSQEQPHRGSFQEERAQEQPSPAAPQPSPPPASNNEVSPATLFGPKSFVPSFSSFGAGAPARVESSLSLADQVRFGFSHVPQTTHAPSPSEPEPAPEPNAHKHDPYPTSFLDDAPAPAKHADMNTYLNVADEQDEMAVHGQTMPPEPPAVELFGDDQWEMATQSPHYNLVEGGHFGADALDEGARLMAEQASLHADTITPDKVPEGFASYGHEDISDRHPADTVGVHQESPPPQTLPHDDQPLVENEDTISGDEVGVEDEEDEDVQRDEYAYGERIEEGDYDQRNYDIVSDDDEGLSEEDNEIELEAEERYGNGEVYDDDGEGEWDDDEEEYESEESYEDEDDHDTRGFQPMRPAAPAPSGEPVVISLLSDSEDEDEPVPAPSKAAAAAQAVPAQEPPTSSDSAPSPEHQGSEGVLDTVEMDSEKENVPDHIFAMTHVVDFATRAVRDANQHVEGLPARTDTDTGPSPFAIQAPRSFEMSSARDESYAPAFEPAPSEGSSQGLFVSQRTAQPAPSESSSEGLFVAQPRHRSPDLADKQADDGSTDEPDRTDEGSTDGDRESVPEQARTRDESSDVEEMEEDDTAPKSSQAQDDDASLPDADDLSFASQVEMAEDLMESEDEYLSADDAPSTAADALDAMGEEIATSEEDVDMIDAGPEHIEPASPEAASQSLQLQQEALDETSAVVSEVVVTEVVSEVATIATADELLPAAQISAPQEAGISSPTANNQGLPAAELLPLEAPEGVPNGQSDPHVASRVFQEEIIQMDVSPVTTPKSKADSPKVQKHVQESLDQAAAAESQHRIDKGTPTEEAPHERVHMPEIEADTDTLEDGAHHGSSSASHPPTVVRLDETAPGDQLPAMRSSVAEQGGEQKASDEAEGPPQTPEPEMAQQPTSPAAEDLEDDEVMLLEQLTQEQQQSFESQATEPPPRTRSPSPDLSVYLARQAVAAKRNKKAPEAPTRTSTRVTRARSSSLRSNATNGTPEKEKTEDTSVTLARAALASPSRRGHEADGAAPSTTTTPTIATLKSQLTKRLRTELPECIPLKSLPMHVDKFPNALVVVTSLPTQPVRAKGGPREYFMSFRVTDPSVAPAKVVEVQLYRPHKDSLPVVSPGDVVLLQRFQVRAISGRGWGLRTGAESAWAVWEGDDGKERGGEAPQIRGPPVEDWEGYVGYVGTLREWFGLVMGDGVAKGKLERAERKLVEAGGGGGGGK